MVWQSQKVSLLFVYFAKVSSYFERMFFLTIRIGMSSPFSHKNAIWTFPEMGCFSHSFRQVNHITFSYSIQYFVPQVQVLVPQMQIFLYWKKNIYIKHPFFLIKINQSIRFDTRSVTERNPQPCSFLFAFSVFNS